MAAKKTKTAAELTKELAEYRSMVEIYREEVEAMKAVRQDSGDTDTDIGPVLLHEDPFDSHNAFRVHGEIEPCVEYPHGAVVQWKNPEYRARRTWRGWIPFEWGDEYTGKKGELLTQFIPDPPKALLGPDKLDNYVRRGDVVLARLDKNIWLARQEKRILESQKRMGLAGSARKTVLSDGVEIVGPGLGDSHRPARGFRPQQESMPPVKDAVRRTFSGPTQPATTDGD